MLQSGYIDDLWIKNINKNLERFNSSLNNIIILNTTFPLHQWALSRTSPLTQASFYRYFIPELIQAERVLYLDSDIIINDSLLPLFEVEMTEVPIYATSDLLINFNSKIHYYHRFPEYDNNVRYQGGASFSPYLNSGVLLFNNIECNKIKFTEKLILSTEKYHNVIYGDQDIINFVCFRNWIDVGIKYNYQVGAVLESQEKKYLYPIVDKPTIIHYTGHRKPWLEKYKNYTSYHQLYWEYKNIPWDSIE